MRQITPHLWYDTQAKEAAEFYVSVFPDSKITNILTLPGTPGGDTDIVSFELWGQPFQAISAGPLFEFNPSISFSVACDTKEQVDEIWSRISAGGGVLMPLDAYPFSERYGWCADRYGLSWQISYAGGREVEQRITPTLLFVGDVCGRAKEAIDLYTSVFEDSSVDLIVPYGPGQEPEVEGSTMYAAFKLAGNQLAAMDSAQDHRFRFNEAVSLLVPCKDQAEIDHFWNALSADPSAEQCGWLKDRFGVSWQITPADMDEKMQTGTPAQVAAITEAFLRMKKFDLAELQAAWDRAS